jgi:RND family efflux transporter MFP subunit
MNRSKLKIVLPLAFLLVAVIVTVALSQARPVAKKEAQVADVPLVRVQTVYPGDLQVEVTSQGTVRSRAETTIVSQVAGRLDAVSPAFAPGGTFRRGDTLAQLDRRDHEVALTQAEAAVAQARVRLSRETAEAQIAREEWSRLGSGEPSALVAREPQLADARAAVRAAEASVAQARLNIERTVIRAPFDGVLLEKLADVGQFVGNGAPIARIAASDYAEVELPLTATDLAQVDIASSPRVILRAASGGGAGEWPARIVRAGAQVDPATRMLPVVARIDRPFDAAPGRPPLQIGQFVQARIEGRTARSVISIPRAALRANDRVFIIDETDRLQFRQVGVYRLTRDAALIDGGLNGGERVVLSSLETPVEGMVVRTTGDEPAMTIVPAAEATR